MTIFPLTDQKTRCLIALYQLEILDTPAEKEYDHIVALAAQVCSRPIVTLGFLDQERVWFKAILGLDVQEMHVNELSHPTSWQAKTPFSIEDTLTDEYTARHPFVVGAPYIRSVTMFPLITENGDMLGQLTVSDTKPGLLTPAQFAGLEMLALQTMSLLKLRLQIIRMKQVQHHSKRTLEQISPVFKHAIDAVLVANEDGVIYQWNPKAEEIFGYSVKEAVGQNFHQLLIPESRHERYFQELRKLKVDDDGRTNNKYELMARRKDQSEFHMALGVSSVMIDGEPLYIGFMTDITERKQIARELAKQKSFYENILSNIPSDIAVFDANHRYLYVNPYCIKDEHLREYIIGKDDFEYATYRKRDNTVPLLRRTQFLKTKVTRRTVSWEDQAIDLNGNPVTHIRRFFPVYHEETGSLSFVIGYGVDITERKKMEEEQNILLERLSFQNTQLIDFCNIVTHNLRGPLNNIAMLVDLVEESDCPEEQQEMLGKLKPVIESLKFTFNELVETVQIKQDMEIKSEVVILEDCLKQTMEGLEMEILKAKAQLRVNFQEAPELYFPPKYVTSIFHNLISNALKYRSPDRVLNIDVSTYKKGSSIFLTVKDNGLGIDLGKHKDHVFKIGKVFHGHANAKGLGLYMTKSQVEVMGGHIEVESVVNEGASFRIEFKNQFKELFGEDRERSQYSC
ncbi:PAS domain S-box protein [Pedobacter immunditicola]|uniref:PAS domain S-box protein n=1 Tax=Pedobacter immunditicola TaxID=3133440 RepID=UPI00309C9340